MTKDDKKIAESVLILLKNKKWKDLSLFDIEKKSKVKNFNKLIKNKNSVIKNINKYFDYNLKLEIKNIEQSNNKDMLFEILMMRFDILQKYRIGIISIFSSFRSRPQDLLFLLPNIVDSIILMLDYTNISHKGIAGQIKIKGILLIYIASFFTWMKDDSISLEKTMITLDKNLDHAGNILSLIK